MGKSNNLAPICTDLSVPPFKKKKKLFLSLSYRNTQEKYTKGSAVFTCYSKWPNTTKVKRKNS